MNETNAAAAAAPAPAAVPVAGPAAAPAAVPAPAPAAVPTADPAPAPDPAEAPAPSPSLVRGDDGRARPAWAATDPLLREYYDTEWGMPVRDEHGLFERISLEAFQAGLSWATILRKRPAFRAAFHNFDPDIVAVFTDADVERLLGDAGIVRNRLKITAAITNARATIDLRAEGGLVDFVWSFQPETTPAPLTYAEIQTNSPQSIALSKALRAKGFAFVGPTTMHALMEAIGMIDTHLVGSHRRGTSGVWPPTPFDGEFPE